MGSIKDAKRKHSRWLRSLDAEINGVAVERRDGKEYIAVYVRKSTTHVRQAVPRELDGYAVQIQEVGEIVAL